MNTLTIRAILFKLILPFYYKKLMATITKLITDSIIEPDDIVAIKVSKKISKEYHNCLMKAINKGLNIKNHWNQGMIILEDSMPIDILRLHFITAKGMKRSIELNCINPGKPISDILFKETFGAMQKYDIRANYI